MESVLNAKDLIIPARDHPRKALLVYILRELKKKNLEATLLPVTMHIAQINLGLYVLPMIVHGDHRGALKTTNALNPTAPSTSHSDLMGMGFFQGEPSFQIGECELSEAVLSRNSFRICAFGLGGEPSCPKPQIWILGASVP